MYRGDICEQKSDKILKANKQLVEVFKTDILSAMSVETSPEGVSVQVRSSPARK